MNSVRIGIIGAGKMTVKRHLPALARLREEGQCIIIGICDINIDAAHAAASTFDIPYVTHRAEDLIGRTDIDAVCIFAPADVHYREGLNTLRSGKHLFVEKPPAKNTEQVKELSALAKHQGRIAAAGYNRRFQKHILEIKKNLRESSIQSAEAIFNKPNAGTLVPFGMETWLGVSAIHALDTLCFIMGERPTALYTAYNGTSNDPRENFSALIVWGDRHAVFSANNSAGSRLERYAFHGYGVSYAVEGQSLHISRDAEDKDEVKTDDDVTGGIYAEFAAFLNAIHEGDEPLHSLDRTISALHLVELIERGHMGTIDWSSIETKNPVGQIDSEIPIRQQIVEGRFSSVLVLNPRALHAELPRLGEHVRIVYREDLEKMSETERRTIGAVLTGGPSAIPLDHELLDLLPGVAILGVLGASIKKWGGEAAIDRGLAIINTADVYADAVAEFIVMQALVGLRRASVSHEVLRKGGWEFSVPRFQDMVREKIRSFAKNSLLRFLKPYISSIRPIIAPVSRPNRATARMLAGRSVGILGFGEITKKTIPLFRAFGCTVYVHSEYMDTETAQTLGVVSSTLDEVLRCDVVSIQRGLSPRTERSFGAQEIGALRSGTVFINSGRAGLVDTEALIKRLKRGDIFACIDVFDSEPLSKDDTLRTLPNVFLTSHLAASIEHTKGLMDLSSRALVDKILAYREQADAVSSIDYRQFKNMT